MPSPDNLMAFDCKERLIESIDRGKLIRENERTQQINNTKTCYNRFETTNGETDKRQPIVGYAGHYPQCKASNVFGKSWKDEKQKGYSRFMKKQKEHFTDRELNNSQNVAESVQQDLPEKVRCPSVGGTPRYHKRSKSNDPVIGYGGHTKQMQNFNLVGMTYIRAKEQAKQESRKNSIIREKIKNDEQKIFQSRNIKEEIYMKKRKLSYSFNNGMPAVLLKGKTRSDWK